MKATIDTGKDLSRSLVKESSVRTWKNEYLQELALRKKTGKETTVKTVAIKKSGRPLLLKQKSPSFLAYNV